MVESYPGGLDDRTVTNGYDEINRLHSEMVTTFPSGRNHQMSMSMGSGGGGSHGNGSTAVTTTYAYDQANNVLSKAVAGGANAGTTTYAYANGLNQLTGVSGPAGSETFTYDANGNRATRVVGTVTDTYTYDCENRLVGFANNTGVNGTRAGTYAYTYDYRTRRVARDESAAGGALTKVVFSGGTSVRELETNNGTLTPTVDYIRGSDYGGGVGGVLYTLRGSTPAYTHENRRGDVVAKTDASGSLTYQAAYLAFGQHPQEHGHTDDRQKANTKDEDPTGMTNEGFRYRDLDTCSFITKDPAGFVDGPNLYTYVKQNPWTMFDPEGLSPELDWDADQPARLENGKPQVKYSDWAHWYGPIVGGERKSWYQDPSGEELARYFHKNSCGGWELNSDSQKEEVIKQQFAVDCAVEAEKAQGTLHAETNLFYGGLATVTGAGVIYEGGLTLGTGIVAAHQGWFAGSSFTSAVTGKDYAQSPEGAVVKAAGGNDYAVAATDTLSLSLSPFAAGISSGPQKLLYHYTTADESSFANGLWRETSVTDKLYTNPLQASQELGIPVPNKVIPVKDVGQFVPNKPPIVQPSFRYQGGGTDLINPEPVPASHLLPAQPLGGG